MGAKRFLESSEFMGKKYPIFDRLAYFEGVSSSRAGGRMVQNYIVTEISFPSPRTGDGNKLSVPKNG
ncbi:MAG: hypothetical protein CK545_03660 [Actinobacteria bacterium]|nr:MAG: hypothetical protein CK545_03660 [Actinomycetota bacterium]